MPIAFLLALQASGMVVDWLGTSEQIRLGRMGEKIERAGINADIQTSRLQAEDESLQAMRQLRQNLGTQFAAAAARGGRGGSSIFVTNQSVSNFNADERMRKINQLGKEAHLRANSTLSKLHQQTSENTAWNTFRQNVVNKIGTSVQAYNTSGKLFS